MFSDFTHLAYIAHLPDLTGHLQHGLFGVAGLTLAGVYFFHVWYFRRLNENFYFALSTLCWGGKEFLLFLVHSTEGLDLLLPLLALLDSLLLLSLVMFFQYRVGFRPKMLRFPVRWLVAGSLVGPFLLALAPVRTLLDFAGWSVTHLFAAFCSLAIARLSLLGFWKKLSGNGLFCTTGLLLPVLELVAFIQEDRVERFRILELPLGMSLVLLMLLAYLVRYRAKQFRRMEAGLKLQKSVGKDFEHQKLEKALKELKSLQSQLVHQEKLASLGQLTAGVAHEINNPINFVASNVKPLQRDIEEIVQILDGLKDLQPDDPDLVPALERLHKLREELACDFLVDEVRQLLTGIDEGATRTIEIVKGLRTFSRADEDDLKVVDIHEALDSTLLLLRNQYKDHVEIVREYHADPEFKCYPGQLNQVFMNLLSNAVQAIEGDGIVTLVTRNDGDSLAIHVRDTGCGIAEKHRAHLFEPFFTTKEVGDGTGLGLSICYGIVQRHGGMIDFETEVGKGSEFILQLPRKAPS